MRKMISVGFDFPVSATLFSVRAIKYPVLLNRKGGLPSFHG